MLWSKLYVYLTSSFKPELHKILSLMTLAFSSSYFVINCSIHGLNLVELQLWRQGMGWIYFKYQPIFSSTLYFI